MIEEQLRHSVQTHGERGRNVSSARAYPCALEQTIAAVNCAMDEQKQLHKYKNKRLLSKYVYI
jgi:hypothetical protein